MFGLALRKCGILIPMDPQQQAPGFWPEFRGYTGSYPTFGQSLMHFGVSGYTTPVQHFSQLSGANPMATMALAQKHFDQGGAVSPTPSKKVRLTPEEVAFCKALKIPFAVFAKHKASLSPD